MNQKLIQADREDRVHGGSEFPLAGYLYEAQPGEFTVDCHWHKEAEFLIVLKGQTLFQIGTTYFPVKAGEAVFIHGGDIHAGHPLGDEGCVFFALVFDMDWLHSGALDRLQNEYITPLLEGRRTLPRQYGGNEAWSKRVLALLHQIQQDLSRQQPGYELAIKARLYLILAEIAAEPGLQARRGGKGVEHHRLELLKQVLSYMEANYSRKIYIKELAEIAHMSESQFCRFFKKLVRKTPVEYINSYRVQKAAELLRQSDRLMLDIALEVGFENPSYFIKRFREHMRCTPAEYRKEAMNGQGV